MQNKRPGEQTSEMALDDIYYVLFRHKKKIIFCLFVGIGIASYLLATKPVIYQSEAELLVKYVSDTASPVGDGAAIRPTGADNVMSSEMDILKSRDISLKVVGEIGAEKILAKVGGGTNVEQAAMMVNENFVVDSVGRSPVMHLYFQHPDMTVVQPILASIIDNYLIRHKEIHDQAAALGEFQAAEKDQFTADLKKILDDLRKVRDTMGVISIDDARTSLQDSKTKTTEEAAKLTEAIDDEKELIGELSKKAEDDAKDATNKVVVKKPELSKDLVKDYNGLKDRIARLYATEQDRLLQYTEQSALVKEVRAQLLDLEGRRKKMEEANPGLIEKAAEETKAAAGESAVADLATEKKKLAKMEKRLKFLGAQLEAIHKDSASIDDAEANIYLLQAKKKNVEDNLAYFSQSVVNSSIEQEFHNGSKTPNIKQIEQPETPTLKPAKANKQAGMAFFGCLAFGIAWAFLIELYLDTSVKRPKEIEGKLGLPLFLSIPDITRRDYRRRLKAVGDNSLLLKDVTSDLPPEAPVNGENGAPAPAATEGVLTKPGSATVAPWDHKHALFPFYEALRNRLLNYFEVKNLHHKPKLVAVTGCNKKSGTTSIAMGLAASLSETGDGNVLLVDMNLEQGGAQQFYKGKPRLDDALKSETRDSALVQDNLYVVSAGNQGDKFSQLLPKRFANLVPQLKASDYDYIIFDMPPINRTGITQRLAGFMDTVLLVVESEKTSRDVVRQATRLLTESKANVSVVLNKTRTYIPGRLHQEF